MPNININRKIVLQNNINTAIVYDPDAQLYFDQLPNAPSVAYKSAINICVLSLKLNTNWSLLDWLPIFGAETQGNAKISLKNPSTTPAITEVNTPTWTANQGYTFNGSSYLDTNYILSVNSINYATNLASLGVYSLTNSNTSVFDMGSYVTAVGEADVGCRFSGGLIGGINNIGSTLPAVADSLGLKSKRRVVSTTIQTWNRGTLIDSDSAAYAASILRPNSKMYIGGINNNGSFGFGSSRKLAFAYTAGALDIPSFNTTMQQLATDLGFAV